MAFRKTTQSKKLVSNLYQNGKYWQYRNPSTGKKVSLGAISQREAILAANQLNNEFAVHQAVDVDAITQRVKRVEKTVNSLLDVWFKNYWQPRIDRGEVSKSTLQNHDLPCFNYTRSAIGDQCIHEVHMSDLTNLLTGTSMSKYRRLRSFWQRMFKYAVGMGLCEDNPANAIMTYKEFGGDTRKKRSRLRWEWFMLIYDKARTTPKWGWFADALIVQLYTAVDRSTLMSMHEDQIRNGIWYYTRKKTRQHPHSHVAVTLPSEVRRIVNQRKGKGFIFGRSDERYTKAFATMVKASGVDGLVPSDKTPPTTHEVRALAGIVNMVHGKSEQEVQRLMAHKDAKMTQHYLSDHQGIKYLGAEPIDIPFSDLSVLEELCT
jgi:enterobacteria phage integrase